MALRTLPSFPIRPPFDALQAYAAVVRNPGHAGASAGGAHLIWRTRWRAGCPACPPGRPRDVRRAGDPVDLRWVKQRWKCHNGDCGRRTFTEWLPGVPPRCRVTGRLREQAGADRRTGPAAVADGGMRSRASPPDEHRTWARGASPGGVAPVRSSAAVAPGASRAPIVTARRAERSRGQAIVRRSAPSSRASSGTVPSSTAPVRSARFSLVRTRMASARFARRRSAPSALRS
jgi:hypothetical protein